MSRLHFFEAIERSIDFQKEYEKLESMCDENYGYSRYSAGITINTWIERNFRHWEKRSNYISFAELRKQLGFLVEYDDGNEYISGFDIDINKYLLFCEMMLNVIAGLQEYNNPAIEEVIIAFMDTIRATVEKAGLEIKTIDEEIMIVEKNAVAIEVADKQPEIAEAVIEYNHYLLRGDLNRKKILLKIIADALEPKRKELNGLNSKMTSDFFYMVNEMDVRHNNCNPNDSKNYKPKFALLNENDKESWYDCIYEQGLSLYMLLEQQDRNKKIASYKNS